ncbi:MAG: hypothetical protein ACKOE8_16850 [Opitutaceae bacterium]
MTLLLPHLLLGVALLCFPRPWLQKVVTLAKRRKKKSDVERLKDPWKNKKPGDPAVQFGTEFKKIRNYIDVVRAAAGSVAIWGGFGFPAAVAGGGIKGLAVKAVIMLVGVAIQATRLHGGRFSFFPPIFYLAGILLGVCGWEVAVFSFILTWALHVMVRNVAWFLTLNAAIVYGFGAFFHGNFSLTVILAAGLVFLPVMLSLLANRPLMIYSSKGGGK